MKKSMDVLIGVCPDIKRAHKLIGMPPTREREPGFATLLRIIVDQQVSVQSGAAIWRRLEEGLDACTPETVLNAGDEHLRTLGLSRPKAKYAICLAETILDGTLDLESLANAEHDVVFEQLTAVKGIGRWTAEVYLMFALDRPDVWPAGDLALAEAAKRLLNLSQRPTIDELDQIGERWRPERTTAAVFLWHCYKKLPLS